MAAGVVAHGAALVLGNLREVGDDLLDRRVLERRCRRAQRSRCRRRPCGACRGGCASSARRCAAPARRSRTEDPGPRRPWEVVLSFYLQWRLGVSRNTGPGRPATRRAVTLGRVKRRGQGGLLVAMGLGSLSLRPQLVGIGPLLPNIQHSLGISHAVAGLLVTIPVLCMGLFAPTAAAARVARRHDSRRLGRARPGRGRRHRPRRITPSAALVLLVTVPVGHRHGARQRADAARRQGRCSSRGPLLGTGVYTTASSSARSSARSSPCRSPTSGSAGAARSAPSASPQPRARSPGSCSRHAGRGAWSTSNGIPRLPVRNLTAWLLVAMFAVRRRQLLRARRVAAERVPGARLERGARRAADRRSSTSRPSLRASSVTFLGDRIGSRRAYMLCSAAVARPRAPCC